MSIARPLTAKERELIDLARAGKTGVAIAAELGVSVNTIYTRTSSVKKKLRIRDRVTLRRALSESAE